ncbi:site-specific DNA-methyltransferase [Acetivibrio clariflavus]|uniref:site-specific DNA-methyltransferase n=1 Tax=Acetivibrio clariflavus TaxID=288965 RepID=UPI000487ADD3|nr:site-specific DNA-methyltransferase [Acetivibrio clariflavus]
MDRKQKLELTWIGKYDEIKVEPRILLEDKSKGYGDPNTENMLIHGDNLLALKALEQDFAGKIKCIYIDPPYNTGNAFEHYDDNLEHSIWLNLMKPRLEILKNLLSNDGSIWISIDADESHYLKVLCDEIFGRKNFIDEIIWQRAFAPVNLKKTLSRSHDCILVYAKNYDNEFQLNKLPRSETQLSNYKNPDNDPRGLWTSSDCTVGPVVPEKLYEITLPSGRKVTPPDGRCWLYTKERFDELVRDNRIWFGENGNNVPRVKKFLTEVKGGVVAITLWLRDEVGDNQEAKREVKAFNNDDVFTTPKPERLIQRILTLATNPGDWVLDSFLGSGTTAAVAHKMGRRWIGIELGDHCYTHCLPRLKAVVDGEQGGISKTVNWQGGGGFRFFELAPSLLKKDKYGNWVIDERYNADMLAAAMAKHQGFTYAPDSEVFWKQGYSYEKDYIFTTTQFVTLEYLDLIHQEMAEDESLLICCKAFQDGADQRYENINVKKIPQVLLNKCDFGVESYSLNIVGLPEIDEEVDDNE